MTRRSNVLAGDQYDYTQANEIELNTSVSPTEPLKVLLLPSPPLFTSVDHGQTREGGRGGEKREERKRKKKNNQLNRSWRDE